MTHAFSDILRRRDARRRHLARAAHFARRSARWALAFAGSALLVIVVAGFAEAQPDPESAFDLPGTWLPRLVGEGSRPIASITGFLLVLFVGGWLTLVGLALLRLALKFGFGPLAVARGVIDEAVRNKTVVVLLGILLIGLAAWPYSTTTMRGEVQQPLRYQIQSVLSFGSLATALLLGAVTILFAAHTVSQDINVRRTGDVFVKPIGRVTYLFGKWLGVVSIMAVILAVQAVLLWGIARLWLGTHYALDAVDQQAVNQRVLVARQEAQPWPPTPFAVLAGQRVESAARDQPEFVALQGPQRLFAQYFAEERAGFFSIPFGETRQYRFYGLSRAKRQAEALDRQIKANADLYLRRLKELGYDEVRPEEISLSSIAPHAQALGVDVQPGLLQWRFSVKGFSDYGNVRGAMNVSVNNQPLNAPVWFMIDEVQIFELPATMVDENGVLELQISNVHPTSNNLIKALQFDPEAGMSIYFMQGTFAPNVARAAVAHWVRLAFLAMLGVIAGSLWSFPVAATFSLILWTLAAGGTWLQETLAGPVANTGVVGVDTAFNRVGMPIVRLLTMGLSRFSELDVAEQLTDGRYISYGAVASHTMWIGVVWMGVLVLVGGYLFRKREIARVQV